MLGMWWGKIIILCEVCTGWVRANCKFLTYHMNTDVLQKWIEAAYIISRQ